MKKVRIYTDGSCYQVASSSGKGGYGVIVLFEDDSYELSGYEPETTNNRMELMGAIVGMEYLQEPHEVELYSDSAYVVECFLQGWYEKWFRNGWVNSSGKPVANKDLWIRLMKSLKGHKVKFVKVKGHADDPLNNRCDEIARDAVLERRNASIVYLGKSQ
jgi:ribonuclease HI